MELQTNENKEIMKDYYNKIKNKFKDDSLLSDGDKPPMHDWG